MRRRGNAAIVAGGTLVALVVITAVVSWFWTPYDPEAIDASARLAPMSWSHPLGADRFGHDVLSQIMAGARVTLLVGVVAVAIAALIGIPLGALAAMRGGWVGETVMRGNDVVFAFPAVLAARKLRKSDL